MQHGDFCWNELMTSDVDKAKSFYKKLFNWEYHDVKVDDFTYTVLKRDDNDLAGMRQIPPEKSKHISPHWMSYIYVDDLEGTLKKALELGAELKVDIRKIGDFGHLAIVDDPTGARIAFWKPAKNEK